MRKIYIISILIFIKISLFAQLPNTDIWLLDIKTTKDSIILSNPVNITNRDGYDNQPAFSADGKYMLYTSIRDGKQSDIFKYDLTSKKITQITNTSTSEYSPTFMPDGKNISVVMVETDSAQRLWKFPINGGEPSLILKEIDSIGYHCWISKNEVALFVLTDPFSIFITNINAPKTIYTKPNDDFKGNGRGMLMVKNNFFSSEKKGLNNFQVSYDYKNDKSYKWIRYITKTHLPSEDFTVLKDCFIYAAGSKLYKVKINTNTHVEFADLAKYGINNITRITVGPNKNKISIVAELK